MGSAQPFAPEKLIVAVLNAEPELKDRLLARLESLFGAADWVSPELPFIWTRYYEAEMGAPLARFFVSCRELVDPARLAALKRTANALELEFSREGRRRVNLDPGLLSLARLVLASTKPSAHRVALSAGIYAEIELLYERGSFRPVEWTYPDYRSPEYLEIFAYLRGLLRAQLK